MRALIGIVLVVPLFLGFVSAQVSAATCRPTRCNGFAEGTNDESAVLPGVLIVIPGPLRKETELYAKGAFAVDGLPPGTYQIEASTPNLDAALTVKSQPAHHPPIQSRKMWLDVTKTETAQGDGFRL